MEKRTLQIEWRWYCECGNDTFKLSMLGTPNNPVRAICTSCGKNLYEQSVSDGGASLVSQTGASLRSEDQT